MYRSETGCGPRGAADPALHCWAMTIELEAQTEGTASGEQFAACRSLIVRIHQWAGWNPRILRGPVP
jgi:hypothetical protein